MKKRFYQLHRKLSLWLALPVFLWALSGLLHPMMANWLRPTIANTFLPPKPITQTENILAPAEAFSQLKELHQLKVFTLSGRPTFLGITPDQQWHFKDAITGKTIPKATELYAEQLARAYAADQKSKLLTITKITEFSSSYGTINRLLPVYRVKLDRPDGLEVIVDPRTGRLASFDTPSKRLFSRLFSWFHTWSFLGKPDNPLRITLILITSALTLLVAFSGVISLFFIKRQNNAETKKSKARHWHRLVGSFSAIFFFLFGISGLAHIAAKYDYDDSTQQVSAQKTTVAELSIPLSAIISNTKSRISKISLAVIDKKPFYRLVSKEGVSMYSSTDGKKVDAGEERYARQLALEFSGYSSENIDKTEIISRFRKDYGFIFKRLPVWRVHYQDQAIWHDTVDTEDAHLAMRTTPARLVEALSFTYLHKFHFLDFVGRETRDIITAIAVILISITVLLGLRIALMKQTSK